MAVTLSSLTANNSTTDNTSFVTASVSPTANRTILVTVCGVSAGTNVNPTISGLGATWTTLQTAGGSGSNTVGRVVRTFSTLSDGTSGTITIDWGATTQARCFWSVSEIVNSLGDYSYAKVQGVSNTRNSGGGSISTYSVTLSAFADAANLTYGALHFSSASAATPGSGFTELSDTNVEIQFLEDEYKDGQDTSVDWSFASADGQATALALELTGTPIILGGSSPMFFSTGGVTVG